MTLNQDKPWKGVIRDWRVESHPGVGGLGFYISGTPTGHPQFKNWMHTSFVVAVEHDEADWEIETNNSRYTLIGHPIDGHYPPGFETATAALLRDGRHNVGYPAGDRPSDSPTD